LGGFTTSKARIVTNLDSFRFDKDTRKIVQQTTKRLPIFGILTLSISTKTHIVEDICENPLDVALVGITFTQSLE
jgi:hypothetical protein